MKFRSRWLVPSALFAAGLVAGGTCVWYFSPPRNNGDTITREGGYQYINPLLTCDMAEDNEYRGFSSLKNKLGDIADTMIAQGKAKRISIYFRDMNKGYWTGIRSDDTFMPASLLKVPVLIAALNDSQDNPNLMDGKIFLKSGPDANAGESIRPPFPLALGRSYSTRELLQAMIEQSDNNALAALKGIISNATLEDVYQQFGVDAPIDETSETVSPKAYMRFFRILYNASYLTRDNSKTALDMLARSNFTDGLTAGVPATVPVAHKFGEREEVASDGVTQRTELHDCGIVYFPDSPYGLCIMTEGSDVTTLKSVIADLSKAAYQQVDTTGILDPTQ